MNEIYFYAGSDVTMNVCLSVLEVVRFVSKKYSVSFDKAALMFYRSKTSEILHNSENGLWAESPEFIANMFYEEQKQSILNFPVANRQFHAV